LTREVYSDSDSEAKTREKYIGPELSKRSWFQKYIKEEVNSVKSDFINKKLGKTFSQIQ